MARSRLLALLVLAVVTWGSLAYTGGYAGYLHSATYRNRCAGKLSASLGLPAEIGRVVARSWRAQEFRDVTVWLPQRRDRAAVCRRAIVHEAPHKGDPGAWWLELVGGDVEISTRTWLREDYRAVLASGLRPGFDPNGPRKVLFRGINLRVRRDDFAARLEEASGHVLFDDPRHGQALVTSQSFNGHVTTAPVALQGVFSPAGSGVQVDEITLVTPLLPVSTLGLAKAAGLPLEHGLFRGRVGYREQPEGKALELSGSLFDARLDELTAAWLPRPWHGVVPEVAVEQLRVVNGRPVALSFHGYLRDVHVSDVLAAWGLRDVGGRLDLSVHAADLSEQGVLRVTAAGTCTDVNLEPLSKAMGWGQVAGTVRAQIDDLGIRANELTALTARLDVEPPAAPGATGYVEGRLIAEVARQAGLRIPEFLLKRLPERIEYRALGVRLEVHDEVLNIFGTHGPEEKTILTVRFAGQDWALINEPGQAFDLRPWLDQARAQLQAALSRPLPDLAEPSLWEKLGPPPQWPPDSAPAGG